MCFFSYEYIPCNFLMTNSLLTHVQYLRDKSVGRLHVRPVELLPECLDLQQHRLYVHRGRAVLHLENVILIGVFLLAQQYYIIRDSSVSRPDQFVHGGEPVQLHRLDDPLHGLVQRDVQPPGHGLVEPNVAAHELGGGRGRVQGWVDLLPQSGQFYLKEEKNYSPFCPAFQIFS